VAFNLDTIKGLFKNKYALAGVAVAAGAGGYVLYKRSRAGTASTDAASTATGVTGVGAGGGTADTTGNDEATWLGSYGVNLQNTLTGYGQTLNDALKGITPTTPTPTNPGPYPGTPKPTASKAYVTKAGDTWASVMNALGYSGTSASALAKWNATHSATAGGKKSNSAASGYAKFGVGTVLAVPTSSPGTL